MGVSIRIKGNYVHLIIRYHGLRKEETTGLRLSSVPSQNKRVMELAEVLRSKKEIELIQRVNGLHVESKLTLLQYYAKCIEEGTMSRYGEWTYHYLQKFNEGNILLSAVTPYWLENFQNRMVKESGCALSSVATYCTQIRKVLHRAVRDGLITSNPCAGVKTIRAPEAVKEFLTAQELNKMNETCIVHTRHRSLSALQIQDIRSGFFFACCTGLRVSDLVRLTWDQVDLQEKILIEVMKKTKRVVAVPLNDVALEILKARPPHEPTGRVFPFVEEQGKKQNGYLKTWAKASGIYKNVTWHTARHTNATMLLENGADLYTVQRLLGHSSISTTARYAVVSDRKKRDAVNALPDFSKPNKKPSAERTAEGKKESSLV